jgi:hypothetical protein
MADQVMQPIDQAIFEALRAPAPSSANGTTIPVLRATHGRWWDAGALRVGHDIVLRIHKPAGDVGLTSQCLVSQGDQRWSHQVGNPHAVARGVAAPDYSVRFPRDFDDPTLTALSGTFRVAWTAVYNVDGWALLNNTSFRTVYQGTLRF